MIYGISLKIDVSKIDKSKLFKGAKGMYLDATVFFDTEKEDKFGSHGEIQQKTEKNDPNIYLGNCKKFYEKGDTQQNFGTQRTPQPKFDSSTFDDTEIPF